jgi:hypothetical protein
MHDTHLPVRLIRVLLVLAAGAAAGCRSAGTAGNRPLAVIDALVHTSFDGRVFAPSQVTFSRAELAAEMRRNGVVGAVSMNRPGDPAADLAGLSIVICPNVATAGDAAALEAGLAAKACRCVTIYLGYADQ